MLMNFFLPGGAVGQAAPLVAVLLEHGPAPKP